MHPKHVWTHYLGLSASFLCLIHCLALPVLTPLLPLFATHNHWLVESIFIVLITLSTMTIYKGYREHREPRSLWIGSFGFCLLTASLFFEHNTIQITLSVLGAAAMTLAHYTNYKLCKITEPCCDHQH
jgi:hypothetical protein